MTPEELIEAEAEWLWKDNGNAFHEWRTVSEHDKQIWRRITLTHFRFLNECGVRVVAEDQSFTAVFNGGEAKVLHHVPAGFMRVQPLPEKEG